MKRFGFTLFLSVLAIQTFGQERPNALKFDEFEISTLNSGYSEDQVDVTKRIDRLVNFARKMPRSEVFIVVYNAQKDDESKRYALKFWLNETSNRLVNGARINPDNITYVRGGYRDEDTIEYWIGPNGSVGPTSSPKYKDSERFGCPEMKMNAFAIRGIIQTHPATFTLWVNPAEAKAKFNWTISVGKILDGQGSQTIIVDPEENRRITVSAEVIGLPLPCNRVVFKTIDFDRIVPRHESISTQDLSVLRARIDNLIEIVRYDLQANGYIVVYERRDSSTGQSTPALAKVQKILANRNFDMKRIKVVKSGYREEECVEFWVLAEGGSPSSPKPSVDDRFVLVSRKKRAKT